MGPSRPDAVCSCSDQKLSLPAFRLAAIVDFVDFTGPLFEVIVDVIQQVSLVAKPGRAPSARLMNSHDGLHVALAHDVEHNVFWKL